MAWIPNFKFTNGTLAMGPFKESQGTKLGKCIVHEWEVLGRTVYVYSSGEIPEDELEGAKEYCLSKVAKWPAG